MDKTTHGISQLNDLGKEEHPVDIHHLITRSSIKISSSSITEASCYYTASNKNGSRVVSMLDSGTEGPGLKSQPRRCRVTVLGKLFTPIVPLFTKQQNW